MALASKAARVEAYAIQNRGCASIIFAESSKRSRKLVAWRQSEAGVTKSSLNPGQRRTVDIIEGDVIEIRALDVHRRPDWAVLAACEGERRSWSLVA